MFNGLLARGKHFMSTMSLNVIPEEYQYHDTSCEFDPGSADPMQGDSLDRQRAAFYHQQQQLMVQQQLQHSRNSLSISGGRSLIDPPCCGSGPSLSAASTPNKWTNFLSRPFGWQLKRTKSVSKLDRKRNLMDPDGPLRSPFLPLNSESSSVNGHMYEQQMMLASRSPHIPQRRIHNGYSSSPYSQDPNSQRRGGSRIKNSQSHESLIAYSTATTHMIDVGDEAVSFSRVHPSVLGRENVLRVTAGGENPATKLYACRTPTDRDRWAESIRRTMNPDRDRRRRVDISLQVWMLEAKGVAPKRKYFCELCLDKVLYSRTSSQPKQDICFWGEQFYFNDLPQSSDVLCINLYREADPRKKKDRTTPIGYVEIPITQLRSRHPVERWYTVSTTGNSKSSNSKGSETPSIRVKARYQSVTILPLRAYSSMLSFMKCNYLNLCLALEPTLSVKAKEDLATSLVRVFHRQRIVTEFLCDLIMAEVQALDNEHLMFRGNSLATKAMESYMKLVAGNYLQETLGEFISSVLDSNDNCEVDPLKLSATSNNNNSSSSNNSSSNNASGFDVVANQRLLTLHVETAWGKVINSVYRFPLELRQVFHALKLRLRAAGKAELTNNLISSSIFLRFLCPAILSPSLFNICAEFPTGAGARNLTLIAKTMQTLANFSKFGGKEHYMEFMNGFVDREWSHMQQFLERISTLSSPGRKECTYDVTVDQGKELSLLHSYLMESWNSMTETDRDRMSELGVNLEHVAEALRDPSNSLNFDDSISQASPLNASPSHQHQPSNSSSSSFSSPKADAENGKHHQHQPPVVTTPLSDYDNSGVFDARGNPSTYKATPVSHLNSTDDYVLPCALDENLTLQRVGYSVQQHRRIVNPRHFPSAFPSTHHHNREVTARDAISGRVAISYVDATSTTTTTTDPTSASTSSAAVTSALSVGPVSSGYQSFNASSTSPESSSNSSSPVERQPKKPTAVATNSAAAMHNQPASSPYRPLAIANPLYSMHTVPLQRSTCHQSMPDIAHNQLGYNNRNGRKLPLSPDSSLEESCSPPSPTVSASCTPETLTKALNLPPRTNPRLKGAARAAAALSLGGAVVGRRTKQPGFVNTADDTDGSSSLADEEAAELRRAAGGPETAPPPMDQLSVLERRRMQDELRRKQQIIEQQRREIDAYQKLIATFSQSMDGGLELTTDATTATPTVTRPAGGASRHDYSLDDSLSNHSSLSDAALIKATEC